MSWKTVAVRECDHLSADLSAYLDGELSTERQRLIADHLSGCDGCRRLVAELREVAAAVAQLPRKTAPLDTLAGVREALERGRVVASVARPAPRLLRLGVGITSAAAVVGLFALAGWYALEHAARQSAGRPHAAPPGGVNERVEPGRRTAPDEFAQRDLRTPSEPGPMAGMAGAPPALARADSPAAADRVAGQRWEGVESTVADEGRDAGTLGRPADGLARAGGGITITRLLDDANRGVDAAAFEVVVTPQTTEEYAAVLGIALALQSPPSGAGPGLTGAPPESAARTADLPVHRVTANEPAGGRALRKAAPPTTPVTLDVETASIGALIQSLATATPAAPPLVFDLARAKVEDARRQLTLEPNAPMAAPALAAPGAANTGASGAARDDSDDARDRPAAPEGGGSRTESPPRPRSPGSAAPAETPEPRSAARKPAAEPTRRGVPPAPSADSGEGAQSRGREPAPPAPAPTRARERADEKEADAESAAPRGVAASKPAERAKAAGRGGSAAPSEGSDAREAAGFRLGRAALESDAPGADAGTGRKVEAETPPADIAAALGYLIDGIEQLRFGVVALGEAVLRRNVAAAAERSESKALKETGPGPSPAAEPALRVRLVIVPPPAPPDAAPAATRPAP